MALIEDINKLLFEGSAKVDLRPILLPSIQLAQIIAGFSNSGGGYIILGAKKKIKQGFEVSGISMDFNVTAITHKALDFLAPKPLVEYGFYTFQERQIFVLTIPASDEPILLQGKIYVRKGTTTIDRDEQKITFNTGGELKIKNISDKLQSYASNVTYAKSKVLAHYQGSLKIMDNLDILLYPEGITKPTSSYEGKILTRILFSSIVDNFEIYLSDLLYEIWLSNPNTLKSNATVTLEQVLNCSDIEDFIKFYAKDKISKMKKGSVKTFIKDNKLISDLNVFTKERINDVEAILQIRHLYAHSNGIIDEQFFKYYSGTLNVGDDYLLSINDALDKLDYLTEMIDLADKASIEKHNLSTL